MSAKRMRWTEEQFEAHLKKTAGAGVQARSPRRAGGTTPAPAVPASKYRSRIVVVDNIRFHSILEADRYLELKMLKQAGDVLLFLRQVPFHLPGGVTYRLDFMVFYPAAETLADLTNGGLVRVEFEDTKGVDLQDSINKRKQVLELYGVEIKVLKRDQVSRQVSL